MKTRNEQIAIIRQLCHPMETLPTMESASIKPLRNITAVLLDVYGTLFVSASGDLGNSDDPTTANAFCQAMKEVGLTLRVTGVEGVQCLHNTIQEFHAQSRQKGVDYPEVDIIEVWRQTIDSLRAKGEIGASESDVDFATLSLLYEMLTNPVWPMPGAAQCLTELTSRGIYVGLVSNGQWFTPLLFPALLGGELEALGIAPEMQFWSYQSGWAKPSERLFLHAADILRERGTLPENILYVGNDMLNDMLPAASLGFHTALFAGDRRSYRRREGDPRVASVKPDVVLLHLQDLLACIRPSHSA